MVFWKKYWVFHSTINTGCWPLVLRTQFPGYHPLTPVTGWVLSAFSLLWYYSAIVSIWIELRMWKEAHNKTIHPKIACKLIMVTVKLNPNKCGLVKNTMFRTKRPGKGKLTLGKHSIIYLSMRLTNFAFVFEQWSTWSG